MDNGVKIMAKQVIYRTNISHVQDAVHSYTLPQGKGISKIIIREHGAVGTCTTYVANTFLSSIKVRINGILFMDWGGTHVASKVAYGMQALKDFYKMSNKGVTMTAEAFIVELPDALPKNAQIDIILKLASYATMGCASDDFTGTYDILYETEDLVKGVVIVPNILWGVWEDTNKVGHLVHYLTTMPFKLRTLILIIEDGDTLADTTYDSLTVTMAGEMFFDGELSSLGTEFEGICGVAHTTGIFYMTFLGGITIPAESFKMDFIAETAGTTKTIHWVAICY